jgi:glycosyltransferase involved in cell wall biosynthesis
MKITVAICTWNRAELLKTTLQSLAALNCGESGDWELVVVDNNSTDSTRDVCRQFESALPLRVVEERQQGHSFSRNRVVANANGEVILWTDDDVLLPADWIGAYRTAILSDPAAGFFGGPIEPEYLAPMPRWMEQNRSVCDGVYARRHLGDQPVRLDAGNLPYGANFATRRSLQQRYPFRAEFGRVGQGLRGYDEIDVLSRMVEDGNYGRWVPAAGIRHLIPASRMTLRYVHDYFRGQGQTWVQRGMVKPAVTNLARQIRFHRRQFWLNRLSRDTRTWFSHWVQLGNLRGQLDQLVPRGK